MKVKAIVAMAKNRGIGIDGKLPWDLPEDLKRLKKLTMGHTVLMGRKSYESIPPKFRPLSGRKNLVVTRDGNWNPNLPDSPLKEGTSVEIFCKSPSDLIQGLKQEDGELWVLGGAEIYKQTLELTDEVYLTLVDAEPEADTFLPEFEESFQLVEEDKEDGFAFLLYKRKSI